MVLKWNTVYREIFVPLLFSPLLASLPEANWRHGEFQCLKLSLSLFKHKCLTVNSRRGETINNWKMAKIMRGKNNTVYSNCLFTCIFYRLFIPWKKQTMAQVNSLSFVYKCKFINSNSIYHLHRAKNHL